MREEPTQAAGNAPERPAKSDGSGEQDLDRRILRGSAWVAVSYGGRQLLSMLTLLILVRLLEPKAFGLVALASTFIYILENVQSAGLSAAVIHRRKEIERAAASALVFGTVGGVLFCGVTVAAAPLVASAFKAPDLTDVLRVMALLFAIHGVGLGWGALLERELDFKSRAKAELSAAIAQIGVSVGLASAGFGVWSLVAGQLVSATIQTSAFWILLPTKPDPRQASWRVLRELVGYGRFVSLGNIMTILLRTVDNLAVGRLLGTSVLGLYAVTFRIANFPTGVLGYVVGRVMFPAYAMLQEDLPAFRRAFVTNLQRVALVATPVNIVLIVAAEPIVTVLLGDRWLPAVDALRILAVYSLVRGYASPCGAVFNAAGKPHLVPLLSLPMGVTIVPALALLIPPLGMTGAALAMLVSVSASALPSLAVAMRILELRPGALARALAPSLVCSLLLALSLTALMSAKDSLPPAVLLGLLLGVGLLVYASTSMLLARETLRPILASLPGSWGRRENAAEGA